jgi:hypothetical protein
MTHQPPAILPENPACAGDHAGHLHFTDTTASAAQGRFTVLTPGRQRDFLKHLELFGNVRLACRAACVSAQTAYRARRASAGFALAWDAALLGARGAAEAVLADRAINGVEEAVYYHGEEVARRRRYDSRLLLAHLARLDRLEARGEVAAALPLLDAAIEALGEGRGLDESLAALLSDSGAGVGAGKGAGAPAKGGGFDPQDRVPGVPSCRTAGADGADAIPPLERRLQAMEAARPSQAPSVAEQIADNPLAQLDREGLEAAQLEAFESGDPRWWEAGVRPGPGADELGPDRLGIDHLDLDPRMAARDHAQLARGGAAEVDHAPAHERSAVVDAHGDAAAVGGVGDAHHRAEGQRAVGGGEAVHVETLAAGGGAAVELATVERGDACAQALDHAGAARRIDGGEVDRSRGRIGGQGFERGRGGERLESGLEQCVRRVGCG